SPLCFFLRHRHSRVLHSFPTRRSSDLRGFTRPSWLRRRSAWRSRRSCCALSYGTCSGASSSSLASPSSASTASTGTGWSGPYSRSEEHTSELQSRENLVCRLLLEEKEN